MPFWNDHPPNMIVQHFLGIPAPSRVARSGDARPEFFAGLLAQWRVVYCGEKRMCQNPYGWRMNIVVLTQDARLFQSISDFVLGHVTCSFFNLIPHHCIQSSKLFLVDVVRIFWTILMTIVGHHQNCIKMTTTDPITVAWGPSGAPPHAAVPAPPPVNWMPAPVNRMGGACGASCPAPIGRELTLQAQGMEIDGIWCDLWVVVCCMLYVFFGFSCLKKTLKSLKENDINSGYAMVVWESDSEDL